VSFGTTYMQTRLLKVLTARQDAGGPMPTFDEMAALIGLRSKSGISRLLVGLEARCLIRRLPNQARAIEVISKSASSIDDGTELALRTYCDASGLSRQFVVTDALREYFKANPIHKGGTS
jgi:SOS-response transcriptional repressor LexA